MAYTKQSQSRQIQTTEKQNTVQVIKSMTVEGSDMYKRFYGVMRERTPQFLASVVTAVSNSYMLQKCDPTKIMFCAMQSASLGLDVNPNLGMAAIVPYTSNGVTSPQFQMQWKGFMQLALRSGQYRALNCDIVFDDEFGGRNIITGEVKIEQVEGGLRTRFISAGSYDEAKKAGVHGVVFYFRLVNGFEKTEYWTLEQCRQHGMAYSMAFKSDLSKGKKLSVWSTNFLAMAKKTVVKNTLSKYGPLSIEMQKAMEIDQKGINPKTGEMEYIDNMQDSSASQSGTKSSAERLKAFLNASEAKEGETLHPTEENEPQTQETANPGESEQPDEEEQYTEPAEDYGDVEDPSLWN